MADSKKYTSKLSGARVLVIGGSSGIGFCVAEASLEYGATVIISSSQQSRIDSSISRLLESYPSAKDRLTGHACDLSTPSMEENIKALFAKTGTVDHIVFTAGDKLTNVSLADASFESIERAGMVRFFAPLLVAKHAAAHLSPGPRSSITLTTGSVSRKPMAGWAVIASYAAGSHGLMRNLALDMAPVRVNLISPGAVETELWEGMPKEAYEGFKKTLKAKHTTGEMGRPEDVAQAYLFVMLDANCTGSVIDTNGGVLLK